MEKVIKLGDKELRLHSSLYSIIDYRNVFGTELFNDITKIDNGKHIKQNDFSLIIDAIFRVIYVLHRPYCKYSYKEFMMTLEFSIINDPDELNLLSQTIGDMFVTMKKGLSNFPQSK